MAAIASQDEAMKERHQQWYDPDITEAPSSMRALLESYSRLPAEQVVPHINKIRESGFAANPYPCIGHFRFLNLTLLTHPLYSSIVSQLRNDPNARYVDIGCCFGQDLRQLVSDGVPSSQLTGLDIAGPLMEIGYDLFLDRDTLESQFAIADVFKGPEQGEPWASLQRHGVDVIHCSALLHLFSREQQVVAATNIGRLLKPNGIIVGRQSGSVKPGDVSAIGAGAMSFRHDLQTFQNLWDEVGLATGTKWKVEGTLDMDGLTKVKNSPIEDENSRRLLFTIRRLG